MQRDSRLTLPLGGDVAAVIFDVDGTLYDQRRLRRRMAVRLAIWMATHPLRARRVGRVLRHFRNAQEHLRLHETGDGALEDAQLSYAASRAQVSEGEVRGVVREWMYERALDLVRDARYPDVPEVLTALRRAGFKLGVYSDYAAGAKLEAMAVSGCFDAVISSYDARVGCFKPNPRGFRVAAEDLAVDPTRCVYVGDRPQVDARGAIDAGMAAVIFSPGTPTEPDDGFLRLGDFRRLVA